jgi:hypothetical protein
MTLDVQQTITVDATILKRKVNILKVRDNYRPIIIEKTEDNFKFCDENDVLDSEYKDYKNIFSYDVSLAPEGKKSFTHKDLRKHIEPWLTSLFQSEHFSLLIGSGLTNAVYDLALDKQASGMSTVDFLGFKDKIDKAAQESAQKTGRKQGNLEDQLRAANELLRGLEIQTNMTDAEALRTAIIGAMQTFSCAILHNESDIAGADEKKREAAFSSLVTFLMSFASRSGTRDRLNIFTTNYDRLIEAGAELAGLHLLDRFIGQLMPIFRSSRLDLDMHYNPPGIRGEPRYLEGVARFTKLHGSIDWIQTGNEIRRIGLPFGAQAIESYLQTPGFGNATPHELMIYPNAAKDRETAYYPYVELFRDFAAAVCRPNSTLVTYGYGFGDEHINRTLRDMLTIPSTHLVIISWGDPLKRIIEIYRDLGRASQITLLIGSNLASLQPLTETFLPKAAIDKASFRMGELLKQRMGTNAHSSGDRDKTDTENKT